MEKLDPVSYAESPKSFQGGIYYLEGTVEEVLQVEAGRGKLVSLSILSPKGAVLLPVLIPETLRSFNLQKGQSLKIGVQAVGQGLLKAEKINKT